MHVPRPGAYPDQGIALRRCGQRDARSTDRSHGARSRHGIRHCRPGSRRPPADGGGDPDGGRQCAPTRRRRLSDPAEPLRDVIARHGLSASKALGQNFILDRQLLARVAAIPGPLEGKRVYEVGPGPGGLTHALLEAGAEVVAVERDRRCIPALNELHESFGGRLRIIEGDALKIDERAVLGEGAHVVANLPYNVGTALLLRWLGGTW